MDEGLLNDLLECSVCLERLDTSSRVLPCQHTFCLKCLKEIVQSHKELKCPECRVPVETKLEELPPNVLLMRILEGMKNSNSSRAQQSHQTTSHSSRQPTRHSAGDGAKQVPHARAIYDYLSKEPGDLSFKKGELICLHRKVDSVWYHGECAGRSGVFPITYTQVVVALPTPIALCKALYDFRMSAPDEEGCLAFDKGAVITVIRRVDDNWAEGRLDQRVGIFPIAFVEMNHAAREVVSHSVVPRPVPPVPDQHSSPRPGHLDHRQHPIRYQQMALSSPIPNMQNYQHIANMSHSHPTYQIPPNHPPASQPVSQVIIPQGISHGGIVSAAVHRNITEPQKDLIQFANINNKSTQMAVQMRIGEPYDNRLRNVKYENYNSTPVHKTERVTFPVSVANFNANNSSDSSSSVTTPSVSVSSVTSPPNTSSNSSADSTEPSSPTSPENTEGNVTVMAAKKNKESQVNENETSVRLNESGSSKLNDSGISRLNESGSSRLNESGSSRLNESGSSRLNESGSSRINESGSARINEPGCARINESGCVRITESGSARLNESGSSRMNDTGSTRINELVSLRLNESGTSRNESTCSTNTSLNVSLPPSDSPKNVQKHSKELETPVKLTKTRAENALLNFSLSPQAALSPSHGKDGVNPANFLVAARTHREHHREREKRNSLTPGTHLQVQNHHALNRHSAEIVATSLLDHAPERVGDRDGARHDREREKERRRRRSRSNDRPLPGAYVALYPYKPQKSDELELKKGAIYMVTERCQDGWFKGCSNRTQRSGVFPGNYVTPARTQKQLDKIAPVAVNKPSPQVPATRPEPPGVAPPPDAPPRTASPTPSSFPWPAPTATPQKAVEKPKEKSGVSLMKRLAAMKKCKSPPPSAYSMDNPVFEDCPGVSSIARNPPAPAPGGHHPVHVRSGSCPSQLLQAMPAEAHAPVVTGGSVSAAVGHRLFGPNGQNAMTMTSSHRIGKHGKERPSVLAVLGNATVGHGKHHATTSRSSAEGVWTPRVAAAAGVAHHQHRKSQSLDAGAALAVTRKEKHSQPPLKERFRCIVPYPPNSEYELELRVDDIVIVHRKRGDGWYKGTLERTGRTGLFPASFVQSCET